MKRLSALLIVVILMCLKSICAHAEPPASGESWSPETAVNLPTYPASPEDIFLKGYHGKGSGIWVKIDPPMTRDRPFRPEKGLIGLSKNLIEGIYIGLDGDGMSKDLILCELKPEKKNGERGSIKSNIDTSALSSRLSMTAQFYDEAANSFRTGKFKRSNSLPPDKNILIIIPLNKGSRARIWFDTKKRQWILYGNDRSSGKDTYRQLNKLATFLWCASGRSIPYINEIYYLDFSHGIPEVTDVETHFVLPPGHPEHLSTQDTSSMEQAEERRIRLSGYLVKAFGRGVVKTDHAGPISAGNIQAQSRSFRNIPSKTTGRPSGILSLPKRQGNKGMVFSSAFRGMDIREAQSPAAFPDSYVDYNISAPLKSNMSWKYQTSYVPMELSSWQTLEIPSLSSNGGTHNLQVHISGHRDRSYKLINGQGDPYDISGFYNIPGSRGPELDLTKGIFAGMGLGMEAAAMGTSLLPAGSVTALSNLSALVGGTAVLTGGVVIAAMAAGASIQYLFHLQDKKIERKRIEYLLDRADRKMSEGHLD